MCRVQQRDYDADIPTKLTSLQQTFDTTNISMQKQVDLTLLPEAKHASFREEVGRLYGETSGYVHWTSAQIHERIAMVDDGRTSGYESAEDVERVNGLIARALAACLVFLFHPVPEYVAGDWLVQPDGSGLRWQFAGSQFVALMDEHFDYKHERQNDLQRIQNERWSAVSF